MAEEDALRSLRRRLALWILPEDHETLRTDVRLIERGYMEAMNNGDRDAQYEASHALFRLQNRLGVNPAEKPEPYNVGVEDVE